MPYGILRRADVADVVLLATQRGPVTLFPALKVQPNATVAEFDDRHPDGADYVIVPAMSRDDDPVVMEWLRSQAAKGALIVGVCAGAKVVAEAGLLDGKRATTHWYTSTNCSRSIPRVRYVADRRIVVDRGCGDDDGNQRVHAGGADPRGGDCWPREGGGRWPRHRRDALGCTSRQSARFQFTRPFAMTAIRNSAAFWHRETLGIELSTGVDEVSLALVADAWSRTYRSRAVTFAPNIATRESRNGIQIVPDQVRSSWPAMSTPASD